MAAGRGPFAQVDAAKVRDLDESEITRFLNAAEPTFRKMASGALLSGARYGELCAAQGRRTSTARPATLHIRKLEERQGRATYS